MILTAPGDDPLIDQAIMVDKSMALRGLANDLRDASDSTILRVTRVIDTLADRGRADQLLDKLRPRLGGLRPPRPAGLARALFRPLDPIIVSASAWRPGDVTVPRSVIAPIATLIQTRLPGIIAIEESLAAGQALSDEVWRDAAGILAGRPLPAEWSLPSFQVRTGIRPQALTSLLITIRLVFSHAPLLLELRRLHEPPLDAIRPMLLEAARAGPLSWSIILALLFEQTSAPASLVEQVLAVARETGFARKLESSLQAVLNMAVNRLDRAVPERMLSDEALDAQAQRAIRLAGFCALRGDMLAFAKKLAHRRRLMAAQCSVQIATGLSDAPAACIPSGPLTPDDEQEAAERLESRLRALRRLDLAARPLGGNEGQDQLLAGAAAFYAGSTAPDWLTRTDRLRLCEILVGAEAALCLAAE